MTGVTGTIFLTIIDRYHDFKPINRAVLVQHFVETLLGKHLSTNAFRGAFDFRNKTHFLGYIAECMVRKDYYILEWEELREATKQYGTQYGLPIDVDGILEAFIAARILLKGGDCVQFRYRSFCEYFIAQRMSDDRDFRDYILHEDRYLSFVNEIEYYSGLNRNDADLIDLVFRRFSQLDEHLRAQEDWKPDLDLFTTFPAPRGATTELISRVERSLNLPAPSDAERDAILEAEIPRDIGQRQEIYRPEFREVGGKWFACLTLYSKLVRNSELVAAEQKRVHLEQALRRWSELSVHLIRLAPNLAKNRRIIINGVMYYIAFGADMSESERLITLYYAIPYSVGKYIFQHLGSEKLDVVLGQPLTGSGDEPLIVRFYRECLYADLDASGFASKLGRLLKDLANAEFLQEVLLRKLLYMARTASREKREKLQGTLVQMLRSRGRRDADDASKFVTTAIERVNRERLLIEYRERIDREAED